MKTIKETILVEQNVTVYVANDGMRFKDERKCKLHEKYKEREDKVKKAQAICIQGLRNFMPLVNQETVEDHIYDWFYVKDREAFRFMKELFCLEDDYDGNYPTILCVEFVDEEYGVDAYLCTLEDCMKSTEDFWKKFGVKLNINPDQINAENIKEKDGKLTWDEIYERAEDKPHLHPYLKAKDEARNQVRCFAMELGAPDLEEAECPEDEIEDYCDIWNLMFDESGNIVSAKIPKAVRILKENGEKNEI